MAPPSAILEGQAFAPSSSAPHRANLHLNGGQVFLIDATAETVLLRCQRSEVRLDPPVGNSPRNVHLAEGWLFQTQAPGASALLDEQLRSRLLRHFEQFHPRLFAVALAAVLAAVAVWKWAIPVLVALAVWMTPATLKQQIDRGTLQSMDFAMAEPSQLSEAQQATQHRIFATLVKASGLDPETVNLQFRDLPGMGPNAFALPGGTVVLTDALVAAYPEDTALIAGVIAHELGHVAEQHGLRRLYQSLSLYVLVAMIAGDVGPILDNLTLEGQTLLNLAFSRRHELAADSYALKLLDQTGYDSAGLTRFFADVAKYDGASWTSSHPLSKDRIKNIETYNQSR